MWNLLVNQPGKQGYGQRPFCDDKGTLGWLLVNDSPYPNEMVCRDVTTGRTPFEPSRAYTEELREVVRICLRYRAGERLGVQELGEVVEKGEVDA